MNDTLTGRQLELIALVASGFTIEQAAKQVHLAPQSAHNILGVARKRAEARTVTHLVAICLTIGYITQSGEGFTPAT